MNRGRIEVIVRCFCALAAIGSACAENAVGPTAIQPVKEPAAKIFANHAGLQNVFEVGPGLINGSAPNGDEGFASLAAMGIRTVICVDGATPDVERAEHHGLRYVHLPIGYDGVSEAMAATFARAVRDLPKPIYIHCFHGKHRSPTAAVVAMVGLGRMTNEEAVAVMRRAATSRQYGGLYEAARRVKPMDAATLDAVSTTFPARAPVPDFVQAMVRIGRTWDELKVIRHAGWRAPPKHPDLSPARTVGRLAEQLRDLTHIDELEARRPAFRALAADARSAARELKKSVDAGDTAAAEQELAVIRRACHACHTQFRD